MARTPHAKRLVATGAAALLVAAACLAAACAARPRDSGAPEAAAPLQLDGYSKSRRDAYNRIYADPSSYTTEPNAFLLECLGRLEARYARGNQPRTPDSHPKRTALDVAMGDGRNTIALAQRGYRATGFDMSDVGVNHARLHAAELGLEIDASVEFHNRFDYGHERWDVVVLMYFPLAADDMRRSVMDSVRPGGYVILERSGGDSYNEILRTFLDWQIIIFEQDFGQPDWANSRGHPMPGLVTRLLARKPHAPAGPG